MIKSFATLILGAFLCTIIANNAIGQNVKSTPHEQICSYAGTNFCVPANGG